MFTRTGLILFVNRYAECVAFYRDKLGIPVMFKKQDLTCFDLGSSYLMVEPADSDSTLQQGGQPRTCLRMNVPNVRQCADALLAKGVKVDYQEHSWGTVAKFVDPDGNLCAFKDDQTFEDQVLGGDTDEK